MRVVYISETYSPQMGYAVNSLPKALARLGVEVHLVTAGLPPYYSMPGYDGVYGTFVGTIREYPTSLDADGYRVHFLPHGRRFGYLRLIGLFDKLKSLQPDIVQTFVAISWIPLEAALAKIVLGFKLFTENHSAASTFPLYQRNPSIFDREHIQSICTRAFPGRLVSLLTEKCYGVTIDCAEIAWQYFGVQKSKVEVMHLGVDTETFYSDPSETGARERERIRAQLGFDSSDIVCIYTGKCTAEKNPLILAKAVEVLRSKGEPFIGLFIGDGTQREAIRATPSCTVLPFMPYRELAPFYRSADVGVWPTNESISMLDAAACGIPLIISDGVVYREHVDGNGIIYRMNDLDNLMSALLRLRDTNLRKRLGSYGAQKMARAFSWKSIAERRLKDYEAAAKHR